MELYRKGETYTKIAQEIGASIPGIKYVISKSQLSKSGPAKSEKSFLFSGIEVVSREELGIDSTIIADSMIENLYQLNSGNALRYKCKDENEAEELSNALDERLEEQKLNEYTVYEMDDNIIAIIKK